MILLIDFVIITQFNIISCVDMFVYFLYLYYFSITDSHSRHHNHSIQIINNFF